MLPWSTDGLLAQKAWGYKSLSLKEGEVSGKDSIPIVQGQSLDRKPVVSGLTSRALPALIRLLRQIGTNPDRGRSRGLVLSLWPGCEGLESRQLMSATPVTVVMQSATTADSKGVTIQYDVTGPLDASVPLTFGVYRSSDNQFSPDDVTVGSQTIPTSATDDAGQPVTAPGEHTLTIPLAGGLPDNPEHPYVLVVAQPGLAGATDPGRSASFRVYTIGVLVHGGAEPASANANGPFWEQLWAKQLRAEGYDFVIPYVWAKLSWTAGAATKQIPILAHLIDRVAGLMPAGAVVDLQVIAHSEGTVIASRALQELKPTPGLAKGFVDLTLLDPYPSSNAPKRQQYSDVGGIFGYGLARVMATQQGWSKDPVPVIPAIVDQAQVYYQHTPVTMAKAGLVNFWGMTHVTAAPGVPVQYADLTGPGISHSGDFGVRDWYWSNVIQHLGDGPMFLNPGELTAAPAEPSSAGSTYTGTAYPGATVEVFAVLANSHTAVGIGRTFADASGDWSLNAATNAPASSHFYARSAVQAFPGARRTFVMHTVRVPLST
jgi:hypothetical protein